MYKKTSSIAITSRFSRAPACTSFTSPISLMMDSDRSLANISLDGPSGAQCLDGRSSPTLEQSSNRFSGIEITNSRLDSLEFLILMLGDTVIEEEGEYVSDHLYRSTHKLLMLLIFQRIIGPISESKWTAMQDYARAIEEISITNTPAHRPAIAETTYIRLAQLQGPMALFPRLDRLSIHEIRSLPKAPISYSIMPIFLSPSLTSLNITGVGNSSRASAVASFLGMLGPQSTLARISLDYFSLSPAILKAIVGCGSLSHLSLTNVGGSINHPSLHALFSMPSLVSIIFHTILEYPASESVETLPGSTRLLELHLAGPFALISEWTKYFSGRCDLQGLVMNIITTDNTANKGGKRQSTQYAKPSFAEIDALIKEAIPPWKHSLVTFVMTLDYPPQYALPSTFLDAFSGFALLEKLALMNSILRDINPAIQRNVSHWPSLRYLHLPWSNVICTVSMESLHHLADYCPHLVFLRLLIQSPEDDPFSEIASRGVQFPHVHTLFVGTWPSAQDQAQDTHIRSVEQLCSVARNLLKIFPRLQTLDTHQDFSEKSWKNIKALVDLCRDAEKYSKALSN